MSDARRPLPRPDEDSEQFWRGCREQELRMQQCDSCGKVRFRPSAVCPACLAEEFHWQPLSGRGRVHSFGVVHRKLVPGFDDVPYVLALVDLDEGPRMTTQIVGCAPQDVCIDMPVEVQFTEVATDVYLSMFTPAQAHQRED